MSLFAWLALAGKNWILIWPQHSTPYCLLKAEMRLKCFVIFFCKENLKMFLNSNLVVCSKIFLVDVKYNENSCSCSKFHDETIFQKYVLFCNTFEKWFHLEIQTSTKATGSSLFHDIDLSSENLRWFAICFGVVRKWRHYDFFLFSSR